jgi:hypothetical protein
MIQEMILALTIETCIVRFNMSFLDLAILDNQSITFAACPPEDGCSSVKGQVKGLGEFELRIGDEADLRLDVSISANAVQSYGQRVARNLHRFCQRDRASCPKHSSYPALEIH